MRCRRGCPGWLFETENMMSEKPKQMYLAKSVTFPGYWGMSADGTHHAIATCCDQGADRQGLFAVYDAYEGCSIGGMGGMTYLEEHGEPKIEGIYDAAGNRFGDDLLDAAETARDGWGFCPGESAVGKKQFDQLKAHKG